MEKYQVLIIGGGPGGYEAAIRLSQYGVSVAVIEKDKLGGICLNWGCIPTKALVKSAELIHELKDSESFGLPKIDVSIDYTKILERKNNVVSQLGAGVEHLFSKRRIPVIHSIATLIRRNSDCFEVHTNDGESYQSDYLIVATGSLPKNLPGISIDEENILSSTGILKLNKLPKSLAVVGGGVVGCEFASIFANFNVEVTIIEFLPRLVAMEDEEISKRLALALKKSGIKVMIKVGVQAISSEGELQKLQLSDESELYAEKVLLSVGRTPQFDIATEGLDLVMDRGAIQINDAMQTSIPRLYAIGDVTAKLQLAHTASKQGLLAVEYILDDIKERSREHHSLNYVNIPRCIFTNPEIGSVGYTEAAAKEEFQEIIVGKFPFSASGKAMAMSATQGFVKTIARKDNKELIGMHIMGPQAAELIAQGAILISQKATVDSIEDIVFAHPTLSEAIMESIEDLRNLSIHKI